MTYYPTITSSRISKGYGYAVSGNTGAISDVNEKYDDVTNTWTTKKVITTPRLIASGFELNGYGYIAGGGDADLTNRLNVTEKYDNVLDAWTTKATLNTAMYNLSEIELNGYGYVVGGDNFGASGITEKYDDVLNTWTTKTSLNTARTSASSFPLNGYGYTAGGSTGAESNVTEKYDDITNTWTTKTALPQTCIPGDNGFLLNSYGYTHIGWSSGSSAIVNKYDDINNTWSATTGLIGVKSSACGFSLNMYGYNFGGAGPSNVVEKYDDVLKTWTAKTSLNTARSVPSGFVIGSILQSIQNPDIQEIIEANKRLRANEAIVTKAASANARNTHNAVVTTTSASYVKSKTITFNLGIIGGYRVLFDLKTSDIAKTAYGRVYRNGVALGTEQSEAGLAYVTKSEDLTTSLSPGDTLELWLHNDGVGTTSAQNFQIAYDDSPTVAVQVVNS